MPRILDFFDGFTSATQPDTSASGIYQEQIGTGDNVTTDFALTSTPIGERAVLVFANRVMHFGTEWTYNEISNEIVFVTAPATGTDIYVYYLISTPSIGGGGGGSGNRVVEYHTVTAGEETAKSFSLLALPDDIDEVVVDVIGGTSMHYTVDYSISGSTFNWSGLGLDGILTNGDVVRLVYFI